MHIDLYVFLRKKQKSDHCFTKEVFAKVCDCFVSEKCEFQTQRESAWDSDAEFGRAKLALSCNDAQHLYLNKSNRQRLDAEIIFDMSQSTLQQDKSYAQ